MTTTNLAIEPRVLAAQHLRYGPRGYDEVMRSMSEDDAELMRRAIEEGDVIHVAGMIRMTQRRRSVVNEAPAIAPDSNAGVDSVPEAPNADVPPPSPEVVDVHPNSWRGDGFMSERNARMREVAKAIEEGARTRDDISDVTGLRENDLRVILGKFLAVGYVTEEEGSLSMTPWGRVMLTTSRAERIILMSIARGARGEERLKRLETAARPGILDAMRSLQERGVIRKNRRYYEIKDPALTIAAEVDGVPNEAELEMFIAAQ